MVDERRGRERPARLTAYMDYVCPYCYLAESVLARLRAEGAVQVEYRPFELRPAPVPRLDPEDPQLQRAWEEGILPLAGRFGVEMRYPPVQPRTRKAHEAAAYAREQDRFPALHERLFRAFFVEGRDIGRVDVLLDLGEAVGLERSGLKVVLDIDKYRDAVVEAQEEALEDGITAVPTLVHGDRRLVGLEPYEAAKTWIRERAGSER